LADLKARILERLYDRWLDQTPGSNKALQWRVEHALLCAPAKKKPRRVSIEAGRWLTEWRQQLQP
jgi:hypothetical protein